MAYNIDIEFDLGVFMRLKLIFVIFLYLNGYNNSNPFTREIFIKIKTFDFSYIPFTFINDKLIDYSQGGKNNTLAYHDKEDDDPNLCERLLNKNFTILLPKSVEYILFFPLIIAWYRNTFFIMRVLTFRSS
jgi:hypothetical protein